MMEAKDTVMSIRKSVELPGDHSLLSMIDFTDKVAEISFKAGQENPKPTVATMYGYELGESDGIREVVEWVEIVDPIELDGAKQYAITLEQWQAQKKKWGIE